MQGKEIKGIKVHQCKFFLYSDILEKFFPEEKDKVSEEISVAAKFSYGDATRTMVPLSEVVDCLDGNEDIKNSMKKELSELTLIAQEANILVDMEN